MISKAADEPTYPDSAECDWLLNDIEVVGKQSLVDHALKHGCDFVSAGNC